MGRSRLLLVVTATGLAAVGLWGFWLEPSSLHKKNYEITLPSWPATCDGTRVALLADLHVGSPFNGRDKLERIVEMTLAAKPDLILLLGDYAIYRIVGGTFVAPEDTAQTLARLSAPAGVFAVLGNNDRGLSAKRVEHAISAAGIPVLEDAAVPIRSGKCQFWLAGLSDYSTGPRKYRGALSGLPLHEPVLAFTHNPDLFPLIPGSVGLVFAGHTHGGQVYIPVLGRLIVPSRYGQRYAIGHIVENDRHLFVSPGLGTTNIPVRFLVPPEISVVTIRSTPGQHPS